MTRWWVVISNTMITDECWLMMSYLTIFFRIWLDMMFGKCCSCVHITLWPLASPTLVHMSLSLMTGVSVYQWYRHSSGVMGDPLSADCPDKQEIEPSTFEEAVKNGETRDWTSRCCRCFHQNYFSPWHPFHFVTSVWHHMTSVWHPCDGRGRVEEHFHVEMDPCHPHPLTLIQWSPRDSGNTLIYKFATASFRSW